MKYLRISERLWELFALWTGFGIGAYFAHFNAVTTLLIIIAFSVQLCWIRLGELVDAIKSK